jgi:tRNA uridine 5-carboxymethylaminomethyl modification enzyme
MNQHRHYDLIVVGGGHAGCEACMATANMGLKVLLITSNVDRIGHTSCNPAVGGLGKGHMVREMDALGGSMGRWADEAAIQVRVLNASKGPAVRATRAQIDRKVYREAVQRDIFGQGNIMVREEMVEDILTENGQVSGVRTTLGELFYAPNVLLTTGTFLQAQIHIGEMNYPGGRRGDSPSVGLSANLVRLGISMDRFMTCTTPRILTSSVDFSKMEPQPGDKPTPRFSILNRVSGKEPNLPQQNCYITWTNERTHEIIAKGYKRSAIYSGAIPVAGPRYCPSIEDKIVRFPEKERHQIFVEPEGTNNPETYPNNIPTGLPLDVQIELLHSVPGLEHCHVIRPGYAIEYDMIPPTQLAPTLEMKSLPGLWCAGQINGTSGYEEAAAQGMWAAMNIAAKHKGMEPFLPGRDMSYIAVLTDDLVTKGTNEPYRMFTSRAEHRLLLRESNADARLTPFGRKYGLVKDAHWELFQNRRERLDQLMTELGERQTTPDARLRDLFAQIGSGLPTSSMPLGELFRRPQVSQQTVAELWPGLMDYPEDCRAEAEVSFRYEGYVKRQEELARRMSRAEKTPLPPDLDYNSIAGLTLEVREKLSAVRPLTLGQAGRIPGITPAALNSIEIQLKKLSAAVRV